MRGGTVDDLDDPDFNANLAYDSKKMGGKASLFQCIIVKTVNQ